MKNRFNSFDVVCMVAELQNLVGMRVNNIYDVDNKTYLLKLHKNDQKNVLLIESGIRIHITNFEWPKNIMPSGFSMKLRKHLKNKRIESINQIERDRIIILKFGTGEATYHIIVELFDRGNVILTDYEMVIVSVLRPHIEDDKIKFVAHEKYPESRARKNYTFDTESLKSQLENKTNTPLKKVFLPLFDYGLPLIEHVLFKYDLHNSKIGKQFNLNDTCSIINLQAALKEAESIMSQAKESYSPKGYIILSKEKKTSENSTEDNTLCTYTEFHPMLYRQHSSLPFNEFDSFNAAADEFFSKVESQKIELNTFKQEQEAIKKLDNIKKGYLNKVQFLENEQFVDKQKAELITRNQKLVDEAILIVRAALANQMSWDEIRSAIGNAAAKGEEVARRIKDLKFEINHISIYLEDPFSADQESSEEDEESKETDVIPGMVVDIDLGLSAFSNATKYYDKKRTASKKQQKTIESQGKVLKLAEKKNKETIKKVQAVSNIQKVRKSFWFEKFFWFISSENFLVIGGRDQQQNELIVRRYLKPKDVYVHAEIHGASSVVIKNPTENPVPPKTLIEAGTASICYSVAWDAKVVPNAYWVWGDQVSKSAPTGEYLPTGSFMIRGKKNFLPPLNFVLGFSVLFRLEDGCIERHRGERKIITNEDDTNFEPNFQDNKNLNLENDEDANKDDEKISEDESENDENNSDSVTQSVSKLEIEDSLLNSLNNMQIESSSGNDEVVVTGIQARKKVTITNVPSVGKNVDEPEKEKSINEKNNSKNVIKRGQRSKIKKISEKYKDQDEEERILRMNILKSAGSFKESAKKKKNKSASTPIIKPTENQKIRREFAPKSQEDNRLVIDEDVFVQEDIELINTLTGKPFPEDELLFAVPVIAPYSSLNGYKFKVKLTPGNGKRGKAAKTALNMFLNDKSIGVHEKDLLHAIKEEQFIKNFPGKVKVSGPGLNIKKK